MHIIYKSYILEKTIRPSKNFNNFYNLTSDKFEKNEMY